MVNVKNIKDEIIKQFKINLEAEIITITELQDRVLVDMVINTCDNESMNFHFSKKYASILWEINFGVTIRSNHE